MGYFGKHRVPEDRVLMYHVDTDPLSLDPARCQDYVGQLVLQALYEPLFVRDVEHGCIGPGAARRHVVSADGLIHTFYLRDGFWSDGRPVTANDFVLAFRRLVDPAVNSPAGLLLEPFLNAESILAGELPVDILGVRALDDCVLEVALENPVNYLETLLAGHNFCPVPCHLMSDPSSEWVPKVTNGPFCMDEFVPGTRIFLRPNALSHRTDGSLAGLQFCIQEHLTSPIRAYEEGRLHITCNTYFPFDRLRDLKGYQDLIMQPSGILFLIQLNASTCPIFSDLRLRRALTMAVDREGIASALNGGVLPWSHFVPKGLAGDLFQEGDGAYDPDLARRLWGGVFSEGDHFCVRILYADFYPNGEILEMVASAWARSLGIRVELEPCGFAEHTRRVDNGEYQAAMVLLTPLYSDPSAFLRYFISDLDDRDADRLSAYLIRAQEGTGRARDMAVVAANRLLRNRVPALPICSGMSVFLQKPEVHGFRLFPDGTATFHHLRFVALEPAESEVRDAQEDYAG